MCPQGGKMSRVYKRGDTWYIDVRAHGRRVRKSIGRNKRQAESAAKRVEAQIINDEYHLSKQDLPVDGLIGKFLEYTHTNHRSSTVKRYKAVLDHFRAYLREERSRIQKLSQITVEVIEGYKAYRKSALVNPNGMQVKDKSEITKFTREGARSKTINIELGTLKNMFNRAIEWGYLKENPVRKVKPVKEDDKKPFRFLTLEESEKLLSACSNELYPIFYTFLNTGMRKGELENLQWQDVDLKGKRIYIRSKQDWKPKTGERDIPISSDLVAVLTEFKKTQKSEASDYVFPVKNIHNHNWLREKLIETVQKAEIENFTKIHDLRHTYASHLTMAGVDAFTLAKLMGHTDIQMTMRYSHLSQGHLDKAVEKLPLKRQ